MSRSVRSLLALLLSLCAGLQAQSPDRITGRVFEANGRPAKQAVLCQQWALSGAIGSLHPLGPAVTTDDQGRFSVSSESLAQGRVNLLVFSQDQKEAALLDVPENGISAALEVRLHGVVSARYAIQTTEVFSGAAITGHVFLPNGTVVGAIAGTTGEIHLPAGDYKLIAGTDETDHVTRELHLQRPDAVIAPIALSPSPVVGHYGHGTPPLSPLSDIDHHPFEVGDLSGRWTLLYFWADWCLPCVETGIPKLIEFAEHHHGDREAYRIIGIRENRRDEAGDWNDFRTKTLHLEEARWHRVPPFPLVYDETTRFTSDWGIQRFPTTVLIDPQGNIVPEGDLQRLETELTKQGSGR